MFFFLNYIISAIIWLFIAYLFHFSLIGWIIGLIISFLFKEFIGPLFIIKTGDRLLNPNNKKSSTTYSPVELTLLLKNFIISEGGYKNSVNYSHKIKGKLTNSDIHFEIGAFKRDFETSELCFKIIYDANNRDMLVDIIFNGKNIDFFGEEIGISFFRNDNWNAGANCWVPIKSNYRKYFTLDGGEIILVFRKSTERIIVNDGLLQALTETFNLCESLNQ